MSDKPQEYKSVDEFLTNPPKRKRKCSTCDRYPHLLADIEKFAAAKKAGTTNATRLQFVNLYLAPRGYKENPSTFRDHLYRCLGYLND